MKRAIFSSRARQEFLKAVRWIAKDNPSSAKSLREVVQKSTLNLAEYPFSGIERIDIAAPPTRFLILPGFSYIIVYDASIKPPVVLRFLHEARDLPELLENL
jgi:toxin ParE1/3/4